MRVRFSLAFLALCLLLPTWVVAQDGKALVTFMGFQMLEDEGSRLFVHVSHEPGLVVEEEETRVVFRMQHARILVRNNKNPLDLRHFPTPVKRARLVPTEGDVEIVIELKQPADVRHRFVDNADGSASLQIDFPPPVRRREAAR